MDQRYLHVPLDGCLPGIKALTANPDDVLMYYIIKCPYGIEDIDDPAMLTYEPDDPMRIWITGVKFSTDANAEPHRREPPTPVQAEIVDGEEGELKEFWDAPVSMMSKRLAAALRDAGVANIDEYPAIITDQTNGEVHDNYVAFNIVGIVGATDHANSEYQSDIHWFDRLALDESAAKETLLFRLKEAKYHIVVHERVRKHLEDAGFDSLRFYTADEL